MQTYFSRNYIWLRKNLHVYSAEKNVYDLVWNNEDIKYREVFHQSEREFSAYNFEHANTENLFKMFDMFENEAKSLVEKNIFTCL